MNDEHYLLTETLPNILDEVDNIISKRIKRTTYDALKRQILLDTYKHASKNLMNAIYIINLAIEAMKEESHPSIE